MDNNKQNLFPIETLSLVYILSIESNYFWCLWNDLIIYLIQHTTASAMQINFLSLIKITGNNKEQNLEIRTFPNPTNKNIIVSFEQEVNDIELVLTTINGQEIYKNHYNSLSNTEIAINGEKGIYFLFIKSYQDQRVVKIVKN